METNKEQVAIMHKGDIWKNLLFESEEQARNYLKFSYSKTKWNEIQENILVNKRYGTKFEIKTLDKYDINITVKHY